MQSPLIVPFINANYDYEGLLYDEFVLKANETMTLSSETYPNALLILVNSHRYLQIKSVLGEYNHPQSNKNQHIHKGIITLINPSNDVLKVSFVIVIQPKSKNHANQ